MNHLKILGARRAGAQNLRTSDSDEIVPVPIPVRQHKSAWKK
jgi:hypothetical protein